MACWKYAAYVLVLSCLSLNYVLSSASGNKKIVCYHGSWSTYRHSNGKFDVTDIDPTLCTHLIYSFVGVAESGEVKVNDPYLDLTDNWGRGNIKKFNELKLKNPALKTLVACGGWNEGSLKFSKIASDITLRKRFVQSAANFVLKHGFDGFDLDWEYPGQRDGNRAQDRDAFVILLREMRALFDSHNLLLTAAVGSTEVSAAISYNIPEISKLLDFINIMTYDLHGSWDKTIGINSPLYPGKTDVTPYQRTLNVDSCVRYWLAQGTPREKLIVGMPLYGRSFTLANPSETTPGSGHTGPGQGGKYSNEAGNLGYNEICENFGTWTRVWDEEQKVPYAYKGNQWVGYDDVQSLAIKADYVNSMQLGGAMVWSIETDDFRGLCGSGTYPLIKILKSKIIGNIPAPIPPSSTSTNSPTESTTTNPPRSTLPGSKEFTCTENGYFVDSEFCDVFHVCAGGSKYTFVCQAGLYFDSNIEACNWIDLVQCINRFEIAENEDNYIE